MPLRSAFLAVICGALLLVDGLMTYGALRHGRDELNPILLAMFRQLGVEETLLLTRTIGLLVLAFMLFSNMPVAAFRVLAALLIVAVLVSFRSAVNDE